MAKLLCIANWPSDGETHAEYPITLELVLSKAEESGGGGDWINCQSSIQLQKTPDGDKTNLSEVSGQMLRRDLQRMVQDLNELISSTDTDHLTFVPITPLFELWLNRLSDDQYGVVVWLDMVEQFGGVSNIGFQGVRFMSNRARLMGFIRALEADLKR